MDQVEAEPIQAAGVIARSPSGKILMVRQNDNGLWTFPGGKLKEGESAEQAVVASPCNCVSGLRALRCASTRSDHSILIGSSGPPAATGKHNRDPCCIGSRGRFRGRKFLCDRSHGVLRCGRSAAIRSCGWSIGSVDSTAWIRNAGMGVIFVEHDGRLLRLAVGRRISSNCRAAAHIDLIQDPRLKATVILAVGKRREELMVALLTVWRWGRQNDLAPGLALGSYGQWCNWVRDPLLALDCTDPVERIAANKQRDPWRQSIMQIFDAWRKYHGDHPVAVADLHDEVRYAIDPQKRGRQYRTAFLAKLAGTRTGGYVLTHQLPAGKWGATTYRLESADGRDMTPDQPPPRLHPFDPDTPF
jgi:hypothetical protein